jgi:hypothetical protein
MAAHRAAEDRPPRVVTACDQAQATGALPQPTSAPPEYGQAGTAHGATSQLPLKPAAPLLITPSGPLVTQGPVR